MTPPGSHKLSSEANSKIFSEIEPVLRSTIGKTRLHTPRLIMLGGQPGSGKTFMLRAAAAAELITANGFMTIDADPLRTYHPEWDALSRQDDQTAAVETHPDAAEWVDKAIDLGIRERCNVIFDGTMGNRDSVINRIRQFKNEGFEIEVRILAVNECHSWLGVLRRYENGKKKRVSPE